MTPLQANLHAFAEADPDLDLDLDLSKEEAEDEYCHGGYHPARVGDVYGDNDQYRIVRKLGWGHFSTVWLAFDSSANRYVALKIIKLSEKYREAAIDEIRVLRRASKGSDQHPGKKHVVQLLDYFLIRGPNGKHVCMVLELLGENMLSLIYKFRDLYKTYRHQELGTTPEEVPDLSFTLGEMPSVASLKEVFHDFYGGLPIPLVQRVLRQVLLGLDYLHRECGLIHTDLKPENILVEIRNVDRVVELVRTEDRARRALSSKGLTIVTSELKTESRSTATTPVRLLRPLPLPILRRSSVWLCCNEEMQPSSACSVESMNDQLAQMSVSGLESPQSSVERKREPGPFLETLEELDQHINVKIADLGNSCYVDQHFTERIQTREYRCPEVLVEAEWGCSLDLWSAGCLFFELITGRFAFRVKLRLCQKRNAEHLMQIILMLVDEEDFERQKAWYDYYDKWFFDEDGVFVEQPLSEIPEAAPEGFDLKKFTQVLQADFYNTKGNKCGPFIFPYELYKKLRWGRHYFNNIVTRVVIGGSHKRVSFLPMELILHDKYNVPKAEALEIGDFLRRMLEIHPKYREDAGGLSNHPWVLKEGETDLVDVPLGSCGEGIVGWCHEATENAEESESSLEDEGN